jgi:hypothetical protein
MLGSKLTQDQACGKESKAQGKTPCDSTAKHLALGREATRNPLCPELTIGDWLKAFWAELESQSKHVDEGEECTCKATETENPHDFQFSQRFGLLPNGSRLSCSALVKDQIPLRALSASSAC